MTEGFFSMKEKKNGPSALMLTLASVFSPLETLGQGLIIRSLSYIDNILMLLLHNMHQNSIYL